jgi:peptide chain release factor 1
LNKSLKFKLDQLLDRYEELSALLSDGEVISDQNRFRNYSKEYADIEPVVNCFREFESRSSELDDAKVCQKIPTMKFGKWRNWK